MAKKYTCQFCHKIFQRDNPRIIYGNGKSCSKECQSAFVKKNKKSDKKILKQCPICKKRFETYLCAEKKTCSPLCYFKARRLGYEEAVRLIPNIKKEIPEWRKRTCIVCELDYIAKNKKQQHCSKDCSAKTKRNRSKKKLYYIQESPISRKNFRGYEWRGI